MSRSNAISLGVALAALLASPAAHAFCRTSSCPNVGTSQVCTPAQGGDCGVPLFWPKPCVGWSLQQDASAKVTFAQAEQIFTTAFDTWMNAACAGGGHPRMRVSEATPAVCTKHEYNQKVGNANIIVFRDAAWPYEGSANTLALTTVTYNLDTGEIYDADMELNSADNNFTVGDGSVDFDLLSIATHETGHFLGLAHSPDVHATMFPDYVEHSTNLRELSPDDINGICAIYPPGDAIPSDCDITPRHGFSVLCAADQPPPDEGCSTAAPGGRAPLGSKAVAVALGAILLATRKRKRRR
jgi:hypothetical protein